MVAAETTSALWGQDDASVGCPRFLLNQMGSSGATIMMTVEGISSAAIAKVDSNPHFGATDTILPVLGWKDIKT